MTQAKHLRQLTLLNGQAGDSIDLNLIVESTLVSEESLNSMTFTLSFMAILGQKGK